MITPDGEALRRITGCTFARGSATVAAACLLAASCNHEADTAGDQTSASGQEVTFVDRFISLDEERWMVSDGWSNGDWMANDFLRQQVRTGPDGLTITLEPSRNRDKPYVSGEIRTIGDRFQYGYYEIDMRVPRGEGVVTGFFTYTGPVFGDPHDEIDIEIIGRATRSISFAMFTDGENKVTEMPLGFDAADDFHLYGFEWTPEAIRWYVDGELLHAETGEDFPLPQVPQIYYLNLWTTETLTDWLGTIRPDGGPYVLGVRCMAHAPRYEGRSLCR